MGLDIQITHSVEASDPEDWDRLSARHMFSSYRCYSFWEKVTSDLPIYIILRSNGSAVARGTFWLSRQEPLPVPFLIRRVMKPVLTRWPPLICRSAWWSGPSGLILPDPPLRDEALAALVQCGLEQSRKNKASYLAFDYLSKEETEWGWPKVFFSPQEFDLGTRLDIIWPDFESFLMSLAHSTRRNYRQHCKNAAELGITVKRYPVVTAVDETLRLIRNVEKHFQTAPNPWARSMLENASMVDATWLAAEKDSRLVGSLLLLGEGRMRFLTLLGLDYSIDWTYYQLVYEAIRCAIDEKVSFLRGGGGAYEFKRRLGFRWENDNYLLAAPTSPLFGRIGHWLSTKKELE
jgi:hypothetical protein